MTRYKERASREKFTTGQIADETREYVEDKREPLTPTVISASPLSLYNTSYPMQLVEHMSSGYNFRTFGAVCDPPVCLKTLSRWCAKYPDFQKAREIGTLACERWWIALGRSAAAGKVPNFSSAVWIFTMKNLFKWRDRHESESRKEEIKEIIHKVKISNGGEIAQRRIEVPFGD